MQPWKYGPLPAELKAEAEMRKKEEEETLKLPDMMKPKQDTEEDFDFRFHIMDAAEGRMDFVKHGMNKPGPYKNPNHHDYRQVSNSNKEFKIRLSVDLLKQKQLMQAQFWTF